uniref:Uncharacterized protein n=1 Tax=Oryza glumipatula TaxID=40148 RepID=A0A0D9Y6J1_9ORYZ
MTGELLTRQADGRRVFPHARTPASSSHSRRTAGELLSHERTPASSSPCARMAGNLAGLPVGSSPARGRPASSSPISDTSTTRGTKTGSTPSYGRHVNQNRFQNYPRI